MDCGFVEPPMWSAVAMVWTCAGQFGVVVGLASEGGCMSTSCAVAAWMSVDPSYRIYQVKGDIYR
jgi:hypothetical protein